MLASAHLVSFLVMAMVNPYSLLKFVTFKLFLFVLCFDWANFPRQYSQIHGIHIWHMHWLLPNFSLPIAFTYMVRQNFPLPNISHVWYCTFLCNCSLKIASTYTIHRKFLHRKKLANMANHELFVKIFLVSIHRYTD